VVEVVESNFTVVVVVSGFTVVVVVSDSAIVVVDEPAADHREAVATPPTTPHVIIEVATTTPKAATRRPKDIWKYNPN
jgi:hypothetical protein